MIRVYNPKNQKILIALAKVGLTRYQVYFTIDRYGLADSKPSSYRAIADRYGKSEPNVSCSVRQALRKLYNHSSFKEFPECKIKKHARLLKKNPSARLLF